MKVGRVALIVFYDTKNNLLLQDRKEISKVGEEYGFFGGGIEEGESPEDAVKRETKEELGFDLRKFEFLGTCESHFDKNSIIERNIYVAPIESSFSEFDQKEGKNMKFFSLDESRNLKMVPGDELVLDKLEDYFDE